MLQKKTEIVVLKVWNIVIELRQMNCKSVKLWAIII